jgi:hypothetical protein
MAASEVKVEAMAEPFRVLVETLKSETGVLLKKVA